MNSKNRWLIYSLCFVNLVLGTEFVWLRFNGELGFDIVREQWERHVASLIGFERRKLADTPPLEQANFWLTDIELSKDRFESAATHAGAAWILDSPQLGFVGQQLATADSKFWRDESRNELDTQAIAAERGEFELLCRAECLRWIASAVEMEPNNLEWRRVQALLLFEIVPFTGRVESRDTEWRAILKSCGKADPTNALYDYLAALYLYNASTTYEWSATDLSLKVNDHSKFSEAQEFLKSGLEKPLLQFGTQAYVSTLACLEHTSLLRLEYQPLIVSRDVPNRPQMLLLSLLRWHTSESSISKRDGKIPDAVGILRNVQLIANQLTRQGNTFDVEYFRLILHSVSLHAIFEIAKEEPTHFDNTELEKIRQALTQADIDQRVHAEALRRMNQHSSRKISIERPLNSALGFSNPFLGVVLMAFSQSLILLAGTLSVFWVLGWQLSKRISDIPRKGLGWLAHFVAWCLAFVVSFLFLAASPSELIPIETQYRVGLAILWISPFALVSLVAYILSRVSAIPMVQYLAMICIMFIPISLVFEWDLVTRFGNAVLQQVKPLFVTIGIIFIGALACYQFFHVRAFARSNPSSCGRKFAIIAVSFIIAILSVFTVGSVHDFAVDMDKRPWIPTATFLYLHGIAIEQQQIQRALNMDKSKLSWAAVQWEQNRGGIVTPLLAVGLMIILSAIKFKTSSKSTVRELLTKRKRIATFWISREIALSCLVATLAFAIPYWLIAANVCAELDNSELENQARILNPEATWANLAAEKAAIRGDLAAMSQINEDVKRLILQSENQKNAD